MIESHEYSQPDTFPSFYSDPPTAGQSLLGAAFRLENDVYNAVKFFEERSMDFPAEPGFELGDVGKSSPLFQAYPDAFQGARSMAEFRFMEQKLTKEVEDRQTVAQGGVAGIAASMGAAILSPTVLIPFGAGARAPTIGKAALSSLGWGAVAAGAQEIPLQARQELRSGAETALGVASGALVAGVLGAGVRKLDPLGWDRLVDGMDAIAAKGAISDLAVRYDLHSQVDDEMIARLNAELPDDSLSAARAPIQPIFEDPGKPLNYETAVGRWLQMHFNNPTVRQHVSNDPTMRSAMYQISNSGLIMRNNLDGVSTARGGDVESRKAQKQAELTGGILGTRKFFKDWYARTESASSLRRMVAFSSYERFRQLVTQGVEERMLGRRHEDPAVDGAAQAYVEMFMKTIREQKQLGMGGTKLSDQQLLQAAVQTVRKDLAIAGDSDLRQIVKEHVLSVLDDAEVRKNPKVREYLKTEFGDTGSKVNTRANLSEQVTDKIMNRWSSSFSRHGTADAISEVPVVPEFVLIDPGKVWTNGRRFREFLEPDIEKIARSFIRSTAGDLELFRVFGTVDPTIKESGRNPFWTEMQARQKEAFAKIDEDLQKTLADDKTTAKQKQEAKSKAAAAKLKYDDTVNHFMRDFGVVVGRIRHTHGIPADPSSIMFRLGRAVINLNTVRLMGSVLLSSVPDMARLVMKTGFVNVMRDGIVPMMNDWQSFKIGVEEARYSGAALDVVMHGRSNAIFDLFDEAEYGNAFERGLQTMTNEIGTVAGFDYWNVGLKSMVGNLLLADISRTLHSVAEGRATKAQNAFLASLGISTADANRLWRQYTQRGGATEVRKGVWLPNTEDWTKVEGRDLYDINEFRELSVEDVMPEGLDEAAQKAFTKNFKEQVRRANEGRDLQQILRSALYRGITNTIVTPGVEKPIWVDATTIGRIFGQFRSFGFSSQTKTLAAGLQQMRPDAGGVNGMSNVGTGIMFSLALGAFAYYLWGQSLGPNHPARRRMLNELDAASRGDRQGLARFADEAIARSGLLGTFEEVRRVAERVPQTRDLVTLADTPTARSPFVKPVTEFFGPSVNLMSELDKLTSAGPLSDQGIEALQRMMPYQNVFYLRAFFDALVDQTKEAVGAR